MEKRFVIALIFVVIIALFALNNAEKVMIDLFFVKIELHQAVVIFLSSILGAVTTAILGSVKNYTLTKETKNMAKELENIKEDKVNLEALLEDRMKEINQLKNNLRSSD